MSQTGLPNLQLTQGVDFSLTLPSPTGGTLTKMGTWDVRYGNLTISVHPPRQRGRAWSDGGGTDANRLEFMIDELTQMIQEIGNGNAPVTGYVLRPSRRAIPRTQLRTFPEVSARALQRLTFDASGAPSVTAQAGAAINAAWQAGLAQSQVIALQIAFGLIPAGSTIDKMQFDLENRYRLGDYVWSDDYRAPSPTIPPTRRTIGRASIWRTATRRSPRLTGRLASPTFSASPSPTSAGRERRSRRSGARGGR